jgi:hypothetical protein
MSFEQLDARQPKRQAPCLIKLFFCQHRGSHIEAGRVPYGCPPCWAEARRSGCIRQTSYLNFARQSETFLRRLRGGRWFKPTDHAHQIPSREGRKPKASGQALMTKNPPRRCAPPLPRGDSQVAIKIICKIQVVGFLQKFAE